MGRDIFVTQVLTKSKNQSENSKNSDKDRLNRNDYTFPVKYIRKLSKKGIDMIDTISNGGSGTVYRAIVRCYPICIQKSIAHKSGNYANKKRILSITENRSQIAVKYVDLANKSNEMKLDEADIMLKLSHPNIVEVYEALVYDGNHSFILMEYSSYGTLETFLRRCSPDIKSEILTETMAKSFIKQLCDGLIYLHDNNLSHGDVHEANVLVFKHVCGITLKLCDFGFTENSNNANMSEDIRQLEILIQTIRDKTSIPLQHT